MDNELLAEHAHPADVEGRWYFTDSNYTHDREGALAVIRACLVLGVPVNDVLTAQAWFALVQRVAALEEALKVERERVDMVLDRSLPVFESDAE